MDKITRQWAILFIGFNICALIFIESYMALLVKTNMPPDSDMHPGAILILFGMFWASVAFGVFLVGVISAAGMLRGSVASKFVAYFATSVNAAAVVCFILHWIRSQVVP